MLSALVGDVLIRRAGSSRLYRRILSIVGSTESHVEEAAQPVYSRWLSSVPPIVTTILAVPGQVELHLLVRAPSAEEGRRRLEDSTTELVAVLGDSVFTTDGRSLEEVAGAALRARGLRVAIAESCTGGLLASRLTDVPGSSDYVTLGIIAYSNDAKRELLGVPAALMHEHGAVSEPVAVSMAEGARARASADVGVGVTGIAGPGGATRRKPVGTVMIAVVGPDDQAGARRHRVSDAIRWVPPENLHVTIRFIGNLQAAPAEALAAAFGRAVVAPPFGLAFAGAGAFPASGAPRVIWLGVAEGRDGLVRVHAAVERRLSALGIAPDRRAYSAHLTLARVKPIAGRSRATVREIVRGFTIRTTSCHIEDVTLYRSHVSSSGSQYEALRRCPLGSEPMVSSST
ncbi:MAG: RNA 2',3'-cyclic phosphodiesterase [Acidobacteria bacterium]|nr:RNA 2',3'-cyclic phosphodiesterase [Acidobacteriota bacterium]